MAEELETKKLSDLPRVQAIGDNDSLVGLNQGSDRLFILKALREYILAIHNADPNAHPALSAFITAEANRATAAANAAGVAATVYPSIATGLAATTNGQYFSVLASAASAYTSLYLNSSGTAVFQKSYPSLDAVNAVLNSPLLPKAMTTADGAETILVGLTSANLERTWLEANGQDGGPTQWAAKLIGRALGFSVQGRTGYLFALTDALDRLTDLCVNEADGQVADFVIQRWAKRIGPLLGLTANAGTVFRNDTYVRGDEVLPVLAKMNAWAAWGSSTIDEWSELAGTAASFGASYYNGGNGATELQHNLAQLGARPALLLPQGGVIPASGSVQVACSNVAPNASFKPTQGTLAGVLGTLIPGTVAGADPWTFSRASSGEPVSIATEQPFLPTQGYAHRADFTLFNEGKNDINSGQPMEQTYAWHSLAFDWMSPFVKRIVVINHFGHSGNPDPSHTAKIKQLNAYIARRYPTQYFDLLAYLSSQQVWVDTGITPTAADRKDQADGCLPASLSRDGMAHMNAATRAAAANKLRSFIASLNWY